MSVHFEQDKPIFVPFREGKSIFNSQGVPRIYKSVEAFRRWFPGHYLGDDGITLVEYAPVRHGEWIEDDTPFAKQRKCSICGKRDNPKTAIRGHYCWYCGAKMDGGKTDGCL